MGNPSPGDQETIVTPSAHSQTLTAAALPGPLRVDHFEILNLLGAGGMGRVFRAFDPRLGRYVAIKFMAPHLISSQEARDNFIQEAKAVCTLTHPHIGVLHDIGEWQSEPYLVFEYLSGGTLQSRIGERQLPLDEVLSYARPLGEALAYAHQRSLVHRDVKPGNILFSDSGELKLVDFGLAKWTGTTEEDTDRRLRGTVAYMSPEQARGEEADQRSDVFSLGVVLYRMAAGRLPFLDRSQAVVLHKILYEEPVSLGVLRPDLPVLFHQVVEKALQKDPSRRYQTARELLDDLHELDQPALPDPDGQAEPGPSRRTALILFATMVAALGVAVYPPPLLRPTANKLQRIVVLPRLSGAAGTDQFATGLANHLVDQLSTTEQFQHAYRVVSSEDVRRQGVATTRQARREFGADLVVGVRVEPRGSDRVIALELIEAASNNQINSRSIQLGPNEWAVESKLRDKLLELLSVAIQADALRLLNSFPKTSASVLFLFLEASGHLATFAGDSTIDRAIEQLQSAVAQDPDFIPARAALAEAFVQKFDYSRDSGWLSKADQQAAVVRKLGSTLAVASTVTGKIALRRGDLPEAEKNLLEAIRLDAADFEAHQQLGRVRLRQKREEEAERLFRQTLQLKPGFWPALIDAGKLYMTQRKYTQAENEFLKAVTNAPNSPVGFWNLGGLYLKLGRFEEAERLIEQSMKRGEMPQAWANLGFSRFYQGKYPEAAEAYRRAVELTPNDWRNLGDLGEAYAQIPGQRRAMEDTLRRAIDLAERHSAGDAKLPKTQSLLAIFHAKLGAQRDAIEHIALALELSQHPDIYCHAARVYALLGDPKTALKMLERALAANYSIDSVGLEPDFASLRSLPEFKRLMEKYRR